MLNTNYVPSHVWKAWGTAAALHAVYALAGPDAVLYGSTALNLYLKEQHAMEAQDVDVYLVVDTAPQYDALVQGVYAQVLRDLDALSGSVRAHVSLSIRFPHAHHVTTSMSVNGHHVADFTRQLRATVLAARTVFPLLQVVAATPCGAFPLSILSFGEMQHRLLATVASMPYVDGDVALPFAGNAWRVEKDALRLRRILDLQAAGFTMAVPRTLHVQRKSAAAPPPLPPFVMVPGSVGGCYCMPVVPARLQHLTLITGVAAVAVEAAASPARQHGLTLATGVAAVAVEAAAATPKPLAVPWPTVALPDMRMDFTRLTTCAARLETLDRQVCASACVRPRHVTHLLCAAQVSVVRTAMSRRVKHVRNAVCKFRSKWRRVRAAFLNDVSDIMESFGVLEQKVLAQWAPLVAGFAERSRAVSEDRVARVRDEKNGALKLALEAMVALEGALCENHYAVVKYQKLISAELARFCHSVGRLSTVATNVSTLNDFDDMYSITLEKLCDEGAAPFVWIQDAPGDTDHMLHTQLEVAMRRAHEVYVGTHDVATFTYAALDGVDCVPRCTVVQGNVISQRATLLHAVKESVLSFCTSPLLRRLRDVSHLADGLSSAHAAMTAAIVENMVPDVMDFTKIRASHRVRMLCLQHLQQ